MGVSEVGEGAGAVALVPWVQPAVASAAARDRVVSLKSGPPGFEENARL
jgi:hypothetical protein